LLRRLDLERIEKMTWQFNKQLCFTVALVSVLISASTAPLVVAEEQLIVPKRTWQGIPGLERTAQGRVFVSWFTGGSKEPAPENTVVLAYSDDAGKTFTEPQAMAVPTGGTRCFDPTLWIDPQGRLWYIFNRGNEMTAQHDVHARICDAPDATPPVFGDEFRVGFDVPYAFRMNKPTVLSSGESIMPVTLAQEPIYGWFAGSKQLQGVGISSDQGRTWSLHGAVKAPEWALECMITELRDQRLWMLIRTSSGVLWESYSQDKGRTWSEGQATKIASPGSRFFIRRLTSGNLLLVNHYNFKGRSHLTARISNDDGATWNEGLLLDERSNISYPDGVEDRGGLIWITYDRDRQRSGDILFATFREVDVVAGKDVSGDVRLKQKVSSLDDLKLVPKDWDAALAGDEVMKRLVKVTAPQVKGAHDAEFVCVGDRAYIVEHDNDVAPGHGAGAAMYCVLTVVNLQTLQVEKTHLLAKAGQAYANVTLPESQVFVPRIIRKDEQTLRTYFCSKSEHEQTWYRDFDLRTQSFDENIHKAKLRTAAGTFDMQPRHFHADAAAQGFTKPPINHGLYIFDSFKEFDGRNYVALNNFPGKQNALAVLLDDFTTFEIIGHYNEPQSQQLSESAVNRLPDGTWMAICRNDGGNYHFTTSRDGNAWTVGETKPFVPNGLNSKPTFDKFGDVYYLGWQENTRVHGCNRSVFNVDISSDGKTWQRKYRFESPHSFQYPTFHEHDGKIWLTVTQSDHGGSSDRIMFGKLEEVGQFESQSGKQRIEWPAPLPPSPALMKRGAKLFTDRDYVIDEMSDAVRDLPFHRQSIEQTDVEVTKPGVLFALTPTIRPAAASQEEALRRAGFTKVDVPEVQLFPGEINRVSLYRKEVKSGERLKFNKMVLLVLADGAAVSKPGLNAPVVIANPGASFQDEARSGAMIIGMDRTPKGRIWGCWTGTGDKKDGYFLLATSDDNGTTWSKPRLAVGARTEPEQKLSGALVGNLWSDQKGRLWLFFDQQLGDPQGRITNWFIRCDDPDAAEPQWSEPVQFAEGCTLNKPTVLKNGDWLLPVSDWQKKTARVFASIDEGASWRERGSLQFPDWEFDEHMTVELRDGRLWMLARTSGQPFESFSSDQGRTWSEARQAATVQNINARFFLRRLKSGRILLVKNGPPTERLAKRSHMSAYLSEDDGQTWKGGLLLDERSSVSYPDGFESPDGLIHILYDWNRHTDAEILLAKFREEDVLAGEIVSRDAKLRMLANKASLPVSIRPDDKWSLQAIEDAKQDRTSIPYDGITPNKMVCDTTLRLMPDNSWIISMLAGDDFEPSPKNYIGITRSTDEGRTWSPLSTVETTFPRSGVTSGQGATEIMTIGDRTTMFFSTHSQTWGRDWQSWQMHSNDSGHTWSKPEPMPGRLAKFTFIRGHIIKRNGDILIPFQHYLGPPEGTPEPPPEEKPWHKTLFHYVSNPCNGVLISHDGGKTFSEHGNIRITDDDRYHGWAENSLVELADGRVAMVIRADRLGGALYYAESSDGGQTWPMFATKTAIPNPGSKATLYGLGGDKVALLHNPNPKHRSPMALWISFDGMKTWPYQRVLQAESCDGPTGRMNYPDGFVSADKQWLHFAFDDNRHRCVHYSVKLPQ
jgi:predicted neuraminidase